MNTKLIVLGAVALVAGCGRAHTSESAPPPQVRVQSTLGFSFLPPPGKDWTEEVTRCQVDYSKKTDPNKVSFFATARDCKLDAPLPDQVDLVAFVSKKKDEWGTDGRFTNISTSFLPETGKTSCVRYRMDVNDNGAKNKGRHPFLLMKVVGRFCTHPQDPGSAVDLAYSIRHIPGFDDNAFRAEGEAFLDSLRFETPATPKSASQ